MKTSKDDLLTQILALELYGYHLFLRRWWSRDGFGYRQRRVVFNGDRE